MAVLGVLTAAALGASAAHFTRARARARAFSMTASPSSQSIMVGSTASYGLTIRRNSFGGHIGFSVTGLPAHTRYQLTFRNGSSTRAVLNVVTGGLTPAGSYHLQVRGSGGGFSTTIRLGLVVTKPSSVPFEISGSVTGLMPGVPQPIDLSVRNPNRVAIVITRLAVDVQSVNAPRATSALPCTTADFSVQQFAGPYPVVVPASSAWTLSGLSIPPATLPQIQLVQRSLNQDGCQGATVTLAYSGNGTAL
jgi:hypothetical protein